MIPAKSRTIRRDRPSRLLHGRAELLGRRHVDLACEHEGRLLGRPLLLHRQLRGGHPLILEAAILGDACGAGRRPTAGPHDLLCDRGGVRYVVAAACKPNNDSMSVCSGAGHPKRGSVCGDEHRAECLSDRRRCGHLVCAEGRRQQLVGRPERPRLHPDGRRCCRRPDHAHDVAAAPGQRSRRSGRSTRSSPPNRCNRHDGVAGCEVSPSSDSGSRPWRARRPTVSRAESRTVPGRPRPPAAALGPELSGRSCRPYGRRTGRSWSAQ